ncbi:PAS domain S-box protein [Aromatoleum sp.]|uniref:PAS domain S-box protein n=1 Tax=Aromatoleum sp. TaxID=2307007 RepID=UPI002FC7D409
MDVVQSENLAEYAENWGLFADQILDFAIYMLDPTGRIQSWNAGAERLYGYAPQEIIGCHFSVCYLPEEVAADQPHRALEIAVQNGTYQEEGLRVRKDHTSFWAATTLTALKDEAGKLRGFAKLTHDISRHKTNEAKYLALFENSHDAILLTRPTDGAILNANSAACHLFGYAEQELLDKRRDDLVELTDPRFVDAWAERAATGAAVAEMTFIRKGGEQFEARVASKLFLDESGQQMSCTTLLDITEKKKAEEAVRASEEKYRTLFDNMTEGFMLGEPVLDSSGHPVDLRYLEVNEALYAQTGLPRNIVGRRLRECLPQIEQLWIDRYAAVARTGKPDLFDAYNADTRRHYEVHTFSPSPGRFAVLFRDITERKRAEQAIKDSERRLAMALDASASSVYDADMATATVHGDNRHFTMLGYAPGEVTSLADWWNLVHPDDREAASEQFDDMIQGRSDRHQSEVRVRAKEGSWRWIFSQATVAERDAQGLAVRLIGTLTDITARKQAEEALRQSEERFRLLYENAPLGIIHIDQNGYVTSVNKKFAELSGYSPEEAVGLTGADLALPEERETIRGRSERLLSGGRRVANLERRLLRKDGSTIWVRITASLMRDTLDRLQGGILIYEDIAERKQAEEALQHSEEKFRATFEHAPLGIAECAVDGRVLEANAKLADILGYTKDELARLTASELNHPGDVEETLAKLQKLATGEADFYAMEKRYLRKDRSLVWVNVTASLVPIPGKPHYLVLTVEDITERKKTEADLKRAMERSYHQANHDMLTGLANRAAFHDRLTDALAYAKRDGHLVALHLLDLDGFKSINDTLGHHIGDLLLQEVAKRLKSQVRNTDLAARLGGDEFVVIQTHLAEPPAAGVFAGKLVEELGRTCVLEGQEVHSGASIGITVFPNDATNPEELIKHADLALYEAKHRGRFNYQFYRKELGAAFLEAQRLEQELVRALRENEFCLYYQPQFDLKNVGRMAGIEALLRWRHPERGMLAAAEFLPDAEHAKLMLLIGEWTLQTACRQHKAWVDAGLSVPLTLNLSATQLRDPRLLETLERILEETGLPASMLQLEMRESVLWDPKFSKNLLAQLKERGLRLALDDFGTEMTALPSLDKFPLDVVKPGQRLVKGLSSHPRGAALLAAIIDVAHNLNIAVCADGVETGDQFTAVKELGCDSAQGYWLSAPLDAHQMQQRIDAALTH